MTTCSEMNKIQRKTKNVISASPNTKSTNLFIYDRGL